MDFLKLIKVILLILWDGYLPQIYQLKFPEYLSFAMVPDSLKIIIVYYSNYFIQNNKKEKEKLQI